ncbi:uncharacterized protein LOC133165447 isoform X2 [Syngnathus typhle]|uniref:uncharacterized protein LOC133165447 isoform X2 n=1 Tax=Syngnathus typhle TaxID=161592 RepID=UPI002A6A4E19|nr:uncharacterized protein LOC133165447 isoform X2 [Syngnathus typhle]
MRFGDILVFGILTRLSLALPGPVDTAVVQLQQWVATGARPVSQRVLLNGIPYTGATRQVDGIIQRMLTDSNPLRLLANQIALSRNHTVLRSRDCILEGLELYWADRVFYDGLPYLSRDRGGAWIAHTPQATALKASWVQALGNPGREGISLQDQCVNLVQKLDLSGEHSGIVMPHFLIPILSVLAFIGLIALSLLISKQQERQYPGGVVGSIVHYAKDMADFHA